MSISELIPDDGPGFGEPTVYIARILDTPVTVSDRVRVVIPEFSEEADWDPAPWTPRVDDAGAAVLPSAGDTAIVAFDTEDNPWIIAWWPYE